MNIEKQVELVYFSELNNTDDKIDRLCPFMDGCPDAEEGEESEKTGAAICKNCIGEARIPELDLPEIADEDTLIKKLTIWAVLLR